MIRLKYIKIQPDPHGGTPRHFFRFKGNYLRLRGEPGSPEYFAHHAELLASTANGKPLKVKSIAPASAAIVEFKSKPSSHMDAMMMAPAERPIHIDYLPGSIGWAIEKYLASRKFASKSQGTQKNYRRLLDLFKARLGSGRIADLRTKHVTLFCREAEEQLGGSRGKAMLAVISNVWQFALGLVEAKMPDEPHNPTAFAQIKYTVQNQRQAWPQEIRERFLRGTSMAAAEDAPRKSAAMAPDHLQLMFALLLYTGQRRSDVQRMRWSDYDLTAKRISVFQQKTGEYVPVPVHRDLAKILATTPRNGEHILTSAWSRNYAGESSLSHAIRNRLREVGVPDGLYTCHGLRTTAGHMLAEAGATEVEIMRILGHKKPDQSHYYIREANKTKVANSGMAKWEAADDSAA